MSMKPVTGFEGLYSVSSDGDVYSHPKSAPGRVHSGIWMTPHVDHKGYLRIRLCKQSKYTKFLVHRLVAFTWIPNPNSVPQINHINGNKRDNRVSNLEWCTCKQNIVHSVVTGLRRTSKGAGL